MFSFGVGGFPGMHSGSVQRQPVNNTELYKVLQVERDATPDQIKKQYRKLAKENHPDKGGDQETFKKISHAYDVLGNDEKRQRYDADGEEGLEGGGGGGGGGDFIDMMFGRQGMKEQRQRRGEDIHSELQCSLETLYIGGVKKMQINKDVLCPECDGHGGPSDAIKTCSDCNGQGMRLRTQQVNPIMVQQSRTTCGTCRGEGKTIAPHLKCRKCQGGGTVKKSKVLEVYINPGAPNGKKIVFSGESDHKPGEVPGDVIFIVKELPHDVFKRKGCNLYLTKELTLYEALTGAKFLLKHLDGRTLVISSKPGDIINPRTIKCIEQEGMPSPKNRSVKGHLFIDFTVKFPAPQELDANKRAGLKKVLPSPPAIPKYDDNDQNVDFYTLEEFDVAKLNAQVQEQREAYEEDEERGGGPGEPMQCRTA